MTTNAVVSASGIENAASTAALILASSIPAGSGVFGSRSPIGQSWLLAGGSVDLTGLGVNDSLSDPSGSVMQPWPSVYTAVRTTPFGSVMLTDFFARSTTGLPTLARSS